MDESEFVKNNGIKLWFFGAKNNKTLKLRLDIYTSRKDSDCKKFNKSNKET